MSKILMIGSGGCGNKLLESFMTILDKSNELNSTYEGLFINSNINEMINLPHYSGSINSFSIIGNGTGKNRSKAKENCKMDKTNLLNFLNRKSKTFDTVYLLFSADGGLGSGSMGIISKLIRLNNSNISINIVVAIPPLQSNRIALENTLDFYEELLELQQKDIVNSIIFINNDKMYNEEEFNNETMKLLLDSIEFGNGSIDTTDSERINSVKGYKVILNLKNIQTMKKAIDDCIKNNPFIQPSEYNCTHLGAIVKEEAYNKEDPINIYRPTDYYKTVYGDRNILVLTGCLMPNEYMNMLREALDDLKNEKSQFTNTIEFIPRNKSINTKKDKLKEHKNDVASIRESLDDDFWD